MRCKEKSGQWLENVDQTHLVLVNGKLLLEKTITTALFIKDQFCHLKNRVGASFCSTAVLRHVEASSFFYMLLHERYLKSYIFENALAYSCR